MRAIVWRGLGREFGDQQSRNVAKRYFGGGSVAPVLVFHLAFFQGTVAQRHPVRHANQLPISEHGTRAFIAVVQNHINASRDQCVIQLICGGFHLGETIG